MPAPRVLITDLPEQTTPVDTDLLVVQDGATTKKMTIGALTTHGGSGTAAHIANPLDAHDASAISAFPNTAPMGGADVQTQLSQAAAEFERLRGGEYVEVGPVPPTDLEWLWADTTVEGTDLTSAYINVRDHGAVGDGVTDDSAAFQAAITAAAAGSDDVTVVVPSGNFLISPGAITLSAPIEIVGTSPGAKLTLALTGVAFTVASDDVTLRGLTLNAASDESVLAVATAQDRTTITDCTVHEARLLVLNAAQTWASASATGDSKDVVVTGNTVVCTNSVTIVESAVDLRYVFGVTVTNNRIAGHRFGITWWGGSADPIGGDGVITNARKCGNMSISHNNVSGASAGIWGSMGIGMAITGNYVTTCSDVGIDSEGSVDVAITGNSVANCLNGGITTFSLNQGVTISGNTVSTTIANGKLIYVYCNSMQEDNRDIVIVGNTMRSSGTIGVCGGDSAQSATYANNVLRDTRLSFAGNNSRLLSVTGNHFVFSTAAGAAFRAIEVAKTHGGGRALIANNTVHSTVSQPAGSVGIYSFQDDYNDSPTTVIASNTVSGFPIDITVEADSAHSARTPTFLIRDNVCAAASIVRTEGTASASQSITFLEGNRDEVGVPVPGAQPGSGLWDRGQIVYSSAPTSLVVGWICTATGSPGTWTPMSP